MREGRGDTSGSPSPGPNGATAVVSNTSSSRAAKPNQQVLVFGLPEAVTASALQTAIVAAGVRRVFVKLIAKVP